MQFNDEINSYMSGRFGCDSLIALATTDGMRPSVRTVNAYYADGAFYAITWAKSGKMREIADNPRIGLCGEWFTGHATAENLGHILLPENAAMLSVLRAAFAAWYDKGHVNEADPDTILLRMKLTDGVLFQNGVRYAFTC